MDKFNKVTEAAGEHIEKVAVPQANGYHGIVPWWHTWALREAFIAGAKWQSQKDKEALKKWLD
jgi:hypothetical protein